MNGNSNSLFSRALRDHRHRNPEPDDTVEKSGQREVGAETYDVENADTLQPVDDDSWLVSRENGIPRGTEAWEAKQLGETAAMEIVKNTITDQLTGGDLTFPSTADEDLPDAVEDLKGTFRQILSGPHLLGDDFDDLVTAAVSDMIDVGDAYWQCLAADGHEDTIPVLALKPLDALTMRINVDDSGNWKEDEPAYYQAPYQSYAGDSIALGDTDPEGLEQDDVVSLRWSGSRRADRIYPLSPTMQVKQWLDLLSNNTTHLNRFYNDNEIPPGLIQFLNANESDVQDIQSKIEDASGDPRSAPVIGGEGEAKWIEIGGSALNLDAIEEQKWFLQLCWAAVGINKHEVGLIEDVNRNTASEQSTVIYKRVTLPTTNTIEQAVNRQILDQFEVWRDLDRPFEFALSRSDPVRERQRENQLLERWQAGGLSYNELRHQLGEEPGDTVVEIGDQEVDFGVLPKDVAKEAIRAAGGGSTIEVNDSE